MNEFNATGTQEISKLPLLIYEACMLSIAYTQNFDELNDVLGKYKI
jgi:hypothetical protein